MRLRMKKKSVFNLGILNLKLHFVLSFNRFGQNDSTVVEKIYEQADTPDIKTDI